jgi:PAS domain S-box-containing protein
MPEDKTTPAPAQSTTSEDILLESYRQIIEETGGVIASADKDGNFIAVGAAISQLTGHEAQQLRGGHFTALAREDWREQVRAFFDRALEGGQQPAMLEFPAETTSGDDAQIRQTVIRLADGDGAAFQVIFQAAAPPAQTRATFDARSRIYRTLAGSLPGVGVLLFDRGLRHIIAEGSALESQGWMRDALEGKTLADALPPEMAVYMEKLYRDALDGNETHFEGEYGDRLYATHVLPVHDDLGEVFAGMVMMQDITESRRVENALRENELRFRGLFENNNDAVFIIDLESIIRVVNWRAVELLGYDDPQELIGQPIIAMIVDEERADSQRRWQAVLHGERQPIYQRTFRRKDNSACSAEVNIALVYNDAGEPSHIQNIVRDITDRRSTEAQLAERVQQLTILREVDAELAEHLNIEYVMNMALDSAMRLTGADAGFIGLLEGEKELRLAAVLGDYQQQQKDTRILRQGVVGRVLRTLEAELIPDVSVDPDYVNHRPATRTKIAVPLVSQDRPIGVLNLESSRVNLFTPATFDFVRLLTARIATAIDNAHLYRQSEKQVAELKELYEQVSALEQLKTDMIRIASHDLRNPLAAVLGYVELMRYEMDSQPENSKLPDYLENLYGSARRIQKIVSDILSLERIEQSAQEADYVPVSMNEMARRVYRENQPQAALAARQMTVSVPDETLHVRADSAQLIEAMSNLVTNAIKYTRDRGEVSIRLFRAGGVVCFEVQDNGFGIRESQQAKLFQPFYRARSNETSGIEGTGLGLHLVKNIVERHGGKIYFESVYGEGSTFGFDLPLADDSP